MPLEHFNEHMIKNRIIIIINAWEKQTVISIKTCQTTMQVLWISTVYGDYNTNPLLYWSTCTCIRLVNPFSSYWHHSGLVVSIYTLKNWGPLFKFQLEHNLHAQLSPCVCVGFLPHSKEMLISSHGVQIRSACQYFIWVEGLFISMEGGCKWTCVPLHLPTSGSDRVH